MYIQVILPLKLDWAPTYKADAQVLRGQRVKVKFARKEYTGVVSRCDVDPDIDPSKILGILSVEDRLPTISETELKLWEFLASYYLCSIGEVYKAAYPSMKLRSEEVVASAQERKEASRKKQLEAIEARINRLKIRLVAKEAAIAATKEGTKARAVLETGKGKIISELEAAQSALLNFAEQQDDRPSITAEPLAKPEHGKPILVQGDMRSRAEEYSRLLASVIDRGGQALVLSPEKALGAHLAGMLDCSLTRCDSDCTAAGRRKVAETLREGSPIAVLGNRNCIFLPYGNLQLVIIDEEQDSSFKQTEPAPRYNGRDAALALGSIHGAQVILGSAAPSLETELNILSGKFERKIVGKVETATAGDRFDAELDDDPALEVIDIPTERRKSGMVESISRKLIDRVRSCDGKAVFIRGWENGEEVQTQCDSLFGEGKVSVMSLPDLKRNASSDFSLVAVLQADAFLRKDDFRADEKAVQLVAMLQNFSQRVILQTAVAERFEGKRSSAELLKERKDFGMPPYSRAVDIIVDDNQPQRGQRMTRLLAEAVPGAIVMEERIRWNLPRGIDLQRSKSAIKAAVSRLESAYKYIGHIIVDVDPVD